MQRKDSEQGKDFGQSKDLLKELFPEIYEGQVEEPQDIESYTTQDVSIYFVDNEPQPQVPLPTSQEEKPLILDQKNQPKHLVFAHNGKLIPDDAVIEFDAFNQRWCNDCLVISRSQYGKSDFYTLSGEKLATRNVHSVNRKLMYHGVEVELRKRQYKEKDYFVFSKTGLAVPEGSRILCLPFNYDKKPKKAVPRAKTSRKFVNDEEIITKHAFLRRKFFFKDTNEWLTLEEKKLLTYDKTNNAFNLNGREVVCNRKKFLENYNPQIHQGKLRLFSESYTPPVTHPQKKRKIEPERNLNVSRPI